MFRLKENTKFLEENNVSNKDYLIFQIESFLLSLVIISPIVLILVNLFIFYNLVWLIAFFLVICFSLIFIITDLLFNEMVKGKYKIKLKLKKELVLNFIISFIFGLIIYTIIMILFYKGVL